MKSDDIRNIIEQLEEIYAEPQIGDIVEIELGDDTLIETTIQDLTKDGVIIHIDEQAIRIMIDAKKQLDEAKYQGRTVPLGKPMQGDVKKSKVYVKGPKGNVVKVNFGDKNMRIKKNSPGHRKSFRARHHCENPGPRWKARYWSCRAW
jgi:hypothetical protein